MKHFAFSTVIILLFALASCASSAQLEGTDADPAPQLEIDALYTEQASSTEKIDESRVVWVGGSPTEKEIIHDGAGEESDESAESPEPFTDANGVVWRIAPTLEYPSLIYCQRCDVFDNNHFNGHILNKKTGQPTSKMHGGHGGVSYYYYFDEQRGLFGFYACSEDGASYEMMKRSEFFSGERLDTLYAFQLIDSSNVQIGHQSYVRVFDDAYLGEKYALIYNNKIVSGYIYDDCHGNKAKEFMVLGSEGKWGIVDLNGSTAIPFIFDDLYIVDDETAFGSLDGKYGIFDVLETAANMLLESGMQFDEPILK
ncbi:MAG: WG repeat-containing protein [Eubacteriaceae bacterium]|nr:WG repeat-containing protein [Eubacteriaceae bacterium]